MPPTTRPAFHGGPNIALKVPPHQFEATVAFYRDVLGLEHQGTHGASETFAFGRARLWIDRVPQLSQAEVWLEVQVEDTAAAVRHLGAHGVVRCDEIEPLPEGLDGFWIANPAGIVHLIARSSAEEV